MQKLSDELKESLHSHFGTSGRYSGGNRKVSTHESAAFLYRYRKQRGVNLGSWFVLEHWIADHPYRSATSPGQSDLDIARGSNARDLLEEHWDTWIVEGDWKWIAERGLNAVRIPIGYYHLCGIDQSVLRGTAFCDFETVFSGAWTRITTAIEVASRYGLGVLIDLHAAPGKQNNDPHSGMSDPPSFFNDQSSRNHTTNVLCILLKALIVHAQSQSPPLVNLIGIELVNEPQPSHDPLLQAWYASAVKALRKIDPVVPLYLGECWNPDHYADFVERLDSHTGLIVLDHHLYRCFTPADNLIPVHEHTRQLSDLSASTPETFARVTEKLGRAGGGLIVGEWSGGLNPRSLAGAPNEQSAYIRAQLALYERCCAGWFFWTYKKQWGGDTGWSLRDAVDGGMFPMQVGLQMEQVVGNDEERRLQARDRERDLAFGNHKRFWSQYPGKYEHQRFPDGFMKGWEAGYVFIDSSALDDQYCRVTELGFKGAWARRTTCDYGKGYWEYEHGFLQGIDAATKDFQISYCR